MKIDVPKLEEIKAMGSNKANQRIMAFLEIADTSSVRQVDMRSLSETLKSKFEDQQLMAEKILKDLDEMIC